MPLLTINDLLNDSDYLASERLARKISSLIKGKTFHTYFHLLYLLRNYLGNEEKTYLEIGSFFGASLCFMMQSPLKTKIYGIDSSLFIDNRFNSLKRNIDFFSKNKPQHSLVILPGNSQDEIIKRRVSIHTSSIDLLYLDGDRSKEGLTNDLKYYSQLVSKGGFVVIDDYYDEIYCPGVSLSIKENLLWIKDNFNIIETIPNLAEAGITEIYQFKKIKYPNLSYNHMLILQKKEHLNV